MVWVPQEDGAAAWWEGGQGGEQVLGWEQLKEKAEGEVAKMKELKCAEWKTLSPSEKDLFLMGELEEEPEPDPRRKCGFWDFGYIESCVLTLGCACVSVRVRVRGVFSCSVSFLRGCVLPCCLCSIMCTTLRRELWLVARAFLELEAEGIEKVAPSSATLPTTQHILRASPVLHLPFILSGPGFALRFCLSHLHSTTRSPPSACWTNGCTLWIEVIVIRLGPAPHSTPLSGRSVKRREPVCLCVCVCVCARVCVLRACVFFVCVREFVCPPLSAHATRCVDCLIVAPFC